MKLRLKNKKILFISSFIFALFLGVAPNANAYYSTLDTGDTLGANKYAASLESQFILDRYDGVNLNGRFDAGINEDSNLRAIFGVGIINFQAGAMYKYIPFPDTSNQPAIGIEAGAVYARVQNVSELAFRVHPLISKRLTVQDLKLNVYGSLPLGVTFRDGNTIYPIQLAVGSEMKIPKYEKFSVFGEVGINVNAAFGYISLAGMYYFDEVAIHK